MLGIGDSFAAIVGKMFGKIRVCKEKTLEGMVGFVGSICLFAIVEGICMDWRLLAKIGVCGIVECFSLQIDNLLLSILFISL